MRLKRVEKFTKAVTKGLLPTQQATVSQVVTGLLVCRCLILAEIARCFQSCVAFPHNLKRVFRFVSNERLSAQASQELVASRLIRQLHHRLKIKPKQYLEVIVDWTSVWPYQVLAALIPLEGRAVPVLQWAVEQWAFPVSQNRYEEQFIGSLRRCLPNSWKVVLVADRGFQRVDFLRCLQQQGFNFVVRVKGDAWVEGRGADCRPLPPPVLVRGELPRPEARVPAGAGARPASLPARELAAGPGHRPAALSHHRDAGQKARLRG
jgi:hypothetical protein